MKSLRWFLGLSVLANLVLGILYWRRSETPMTAPTPTAASVPTPSAGPKLQLENDQFDFSETTLSDEAWKIETPELPAAPVADSAQ